MPRIYDSANNPLDFCTGCFPKDEATAEDKYGDVGEGPDGRTNCFSYDSEHPDYDGTDYRCKKCRKPLTSRDN
jgi:hypothetical protein